MTAEIKKREYFYYRHDTFSARKFAEWNTELTTVKTEPVRVSTAAAT